MRLVSETMAIGSVWYPLDRRYLVHAYLEKKAEIDIGRSQLRGKLRDSAAEEAEIKEIYLVVIGITTRGYNGVDIAYLIGR